MHIEFPLDVIFGRALELSIMSELSATHDPLYAAAFLEEHQAAVNRAIRRRMQSLSVAEIAQELRALRLR